MKCIILAGGIGSGLWPLSREKYPKQFLSLGEDQSFIQSTYETVRSLCSKEDIFVVTSQEYYHNVVGHINQVCEGEFSNVIVEPERCNTAPAIGYSLKFLKEKKAILEDEPLLFIPSDNFYRQKEDLIKAVEDAVQYTKDKIVSFGFKAKSPDESCGYIKMGKELRKDIFEVDSFKEKPRGSDAIQFLESADYLWNSGIFFSTLKVFEESFKDSIPEIGEFIVSGKLDNLDEYLKLPKTSFDYGVMEKSNRLVVCKLAVNWRDTASWQHIYDGGEKDVNGNLFIGDVQSVNSKNNLVIGSSHLVVLNGVENVTVVEAEDVILVTDRETDSSAVLEKLQQDNRNEVSEPVTSHRPWGRYTILGEGNGYKIKRITVNPGGVLSLQRHIHRSEHWVVVSGTALVQIGDNEHFLEANKSVFVPMSEKHRLSNPGKIPLEIIEVQNGDYLGEDDIERFEDNYGRTKS